MALDVVGWNSPAARLFAGVSFGRSSGRLKMALLLCRGEGWSLRVHESHSLSLPTESTPLPELIGNAFHDICDRARVSPGAVDVIGLTDIAESQESRVAAILAGQTGVTCVSGFHHQDIAAGGCGKPFGPVPNWFLHRSARAGRLLVDLGPTLRVTLLPRGGGPDKIVCFDAGPCCHFLDRLMAALSRGRYPFDPSGHFAVQGTSSESLINKWISHPFLLKAPPRFLENDDFSDGFLDDSLAFARELKLSAPDVLCSANHFVIRNLQEAVHRFLDIEQVEQVRVCGGGSWNGLLWKLVTETFSPKPVIRTDDLGVPSETRRAIQAALLGYCAIEHLPANIPALTGARRPRVLGQITPGAEDNWDRCIVNLADRFEIRENAA